MEASKGKGKERAIEDDQSASTSTSTSNTISSSSSTSPWEQLFSSPDSFVYSKSDDSTSTSTLPKSSNLDSQSSSSSSDLSTSRSILFPSNSTYPSLDFSFQNQAPIRRRTKTIRSKEFRPPLTQPEKVQFEKIFDLLAKEESFRVEGSRAKVAGKDKGKGGKIDQEEEGTEEVSLEGIEGSKETEMGVDETLDAIMSRSSIQKEEMITEGRSGRSSDSQMIGLFESNPIGGSSHLQSFKNRNRIDSNRQDEQQFGVGYGKTSKSPRELGSSIRNEIKNHYNLIGEENFNEQDLKEIKEKLLAAKEEIGELRELDDVWKWFGEKVWGVRVEEEFFSSTTEPPFGIKTPYYSSVMTHLSQTFHKRFDSPSSSIALFNLVGKISIDSLILSSSIGFYGQILKVHWFEFGDWRSCLEVLERAERVGLLDSKEKKGAYEEEAEELEMGSGNENFREVVETIRNGIRSSVLSKVGLSEGKSEGSNEGRHQAPESTFKTPSTHLSNSESKPYSFKIPISELKSLQKEFNSYSQESLEKLQVVEKMRKLVGSPTRVESQIEKEKERQKGKRMEFEESSRSHIDTESEDRSPGFRRSEFFGSKSSKGSFSETGSIGNSPYIRSRWESEKREKKGIDYGKKFSRQDPSGGAFKRAVERKKSAWFRGEEEFGASSGKKIERKEKKGGRDGEKAKDLGGGRWGA